MYNYAQECGIFIRPLGISSAAHLLRSPFLLIERLRTDGSIVSIPSWIMAITVIVCFPGSADADCDNHSVQG